MSPSRKKVTLDFTDLCLRIGQRDVLKGVSGVAEPGQLLAIMGPSGSGKTVLLNCLAGRHRRLEGGRIRLNGHRLNKQLRRQISFVLQEDLFLDQLTLRETLMFTAQLRLPDSMSYQEKLQKVENIVDVLDLRRCLDTKIGNSLNRGLSGGEKKRANIGCELLTDPSILLLDEPTSGLDSRTASDLLDTLKRYAISSNKTVVTSIHQPSSHVFHLFDRLLLLSEGQTVYFGEAFQVLDYFAQMGLRCPQHYNPADFIIDKVKGTDEERAIIHQIARQQSWNEPHNNVRHSVVTINSDVIDVALNGFEGRFNHGMSICSVTDLNDSVFTNNLVNGTDMVSVGNTVTILGNANVNTNAASQKALRADYKLPRHFGVSADGRLKGAQRVSRESSVDSSSHGSRDDKWVTGFRSQLWTLTRRNFRQNRAIVLSPLDVFKHTFIAFVVGCLWFQIPHTEENIRNISGMVFFLTAYWGFESIYSVLSWFPSERHVIFKERSSGAYRLSAYFLSKIISGFPLKVIMPAVSVTLAFWLVGLHLSVVAYLCFLATVVIAVQVGQGIGLLISASASSTHQALVVSSLAMLTSMLLGGFYVETLPSALRWLPYTSFTSYVYGAFLSAVFVVVPQPIRCSVTGVSDFAECLVTSAFTNSSDGAANVSALTNTTTSPEFRQSFMSSAALVDSLTIVSLPIYGYYAALGGFIVVIYTLSYLVLRFGRKPN
ncbi:uncharacterized protein [Diadema setosum]|uniref:uncharacterized protein n=1 Tax=Diadema setosum TaxID=31175 RepID=UPI003B3B0DCF